MLCSHTVASTSNYSAVLRLFSSGELRNSQRHSGYDGSKQDVDIDTLFVCVQYLVSASLQSLLGLNILHLDSLRGISHFHMFPLRPGEEINSKIS